MPTPRNRGPDAARRRPWPDADSPWQIWLARLCLGGFALALWELGAKYLFDPFLFSRPSAIITRLGAEIAEPAFYKDLSVTLTELALGYSLGAVGGIVLGILLAKSRFTAIVVDPFLQALNCIPRVALAPMLIVWFGIDMASKIFLAGTLVFFIVFFNTITGIRAVDHGLIAVARVQGATERQLFTKIILPGAASWIITGLKTSLPFALVGVILGEFLVSASGLGYRLNMYSTTYDITGALSIVLALMIITMALSQAANMLEARILRWQPRPTDQLATPRA